jgi:hypothetical protein
MEKTFDELILELDDMQGILDYRYQDGSSVWLSVRFDLRMMNFANSTGSINTEKVSRISKLTIISYFIHTLFNSPLLNRSNVNILSIANYEGNKEIPNIWTSFLKKIDANKTRELLYSHQFISFGNKKGYYSLDYFYNIAKIKAKTKKWAFNKLKNNRQDLDGFFHLLEEKLGRYITNKDWINLKNQVYYIDSLSKSYFTQILHYLKAVKPKLIVTSEGNNGDWKYCALFRAAHALNITTAEVQHGALGLGMRYGGQLAKNPEFRSQKSTYLLTFGEYHNGCSNAAGQNLALGNFRLEQEMLGMNTAVKKEGHQKIRLLFISEGIPPSALNNGFVTTVAKALKKVDDNYEFIVRLHPSEKSREKYEVFEHKNISYSTGNYNSIYSVLESSDIVMGHASTVLFEAAYFKKKILIYEDKVSLKYMPSGLGYWFSDAEKLLELINQTERKDFQENYFWKGGDYCENFLAFYNNHILKQGEVKRL